MSAFDRRTILAGSTAAGAMLAFLPPALAADKKTPLTMHRSPTCGCCHKWAALAEKAGFALTVVNSDDIIAVKKKLGVPRGVMSCHTSQVGGYVVEGHMPFAAIRKLLRDKPKGVIGIGLAGMPWGSPGMETADGHADPFNIQSWDAKGDLKAFSV